MQRVGNQSPVTTQIRLWISLLIALLLVAGYLASFTPVAYANEESECTQFGSPRSDFVTITGDGVVYCGLGGNDTIIVEGSNAVIHGGPGNDTIIVEGSNAVIYGGPGNDTISVPQGTNTIDGGPGNDRITGGTGDDTILGGPGNDTISVPQGTNTIDGGPGNDRITGGTGDDSILTGPGSDTVNAGSGSDRIIANGSRNILSGGPGDDFIVASNGNDRVTGNSGEDDCYSASRLALSVRNIRECAQVMAGDESRPLVHRNFLSNGAIELWAQPGSNWHTSATSEFSYQWFACEKRVLPGKNQIPDEANCAIEEDYSGPSIQPIGELPQFFAVVISKTTPAGSESRVASIGVGDDVSPPILENVVLSSRKFDTAREDWWTPEELCFWSGNKGILPQSGKCGTWISGDWFDHYLPAHNKGRFLSIEFELDDLDSGVASGVTACSLFRYDLDEEGFISSNPLYSGRAQAQLIAGNYQQGKWRCEVPLSLLDDVGRWNISILTRDVNGHGIYHMGLQPNWRIGTWDKDGLPICPADTSLECETLLVEGDGWYTRVKLSGIHPERPSDFYQNVRTDVGPSWIEVSKLQ